MTSGKLLHSQGNRIQCFPCGEFSGPTIAPPIHMPSTPTQNFTISDIEVRKIGIHQSDISQSLLSPLAVLFSPMVASRFSASTFTESGNVIWTHDLDLSQLGITYSHAPPDDRFDVDNTSGYNWYPYDVWSLSVTLLEYLKTPDEGRVILNICYVWLLCIKGYT